ncbi:MAG TPA: asparagine synthase-related protein [Thermoleophilaceae bacterium]|jgi:asparagine synthase (glutamine-hydrolysing)
MHSLRPLGQESEGAWAGTVGRIGVALGVCEASQPGAPLSLDQPLRSADGALCLVADAVLDCRAELEASLPMPAGEPSSDPQLILAAYARWGDGCLDRLSGEFAFAIADARRGGVLIARDQIGMRPLQVHRRRGVVAFATTALSMCALDGVGHELDAARVAEWLALRMDTERTFVTGVTTLPPGHCAWVDGEGLRRRRYWTVDPNRIVELGSPEAYAAELRETFDSAVERRLPAGEPVGVMLSGGLDSTSVAATAARLRPSDVIRTYTAAPPPGWAGPTDPNVDADESRLVRELATWHPNLRPAFIGDSGAPVLSSHDARFAAGSPPPRNPCNELWMSEAQRRAGAEGVGTLLTGARGNAFFSADDRFWLAALLSRGRLGALGHEIAALAASTGSSRIRTAGRELARQLAPPAIHRAREVARARRAGISAEVELRFAGPGTEALVRQHVRAFRPAPRRSMRAEALRLVTYSGFIAESAAVRDALAGVRRSDPTSDIRVIALCATQPPWARRHDGRTRVVSRDAMADRLPPSIVERTRRGAQLPDWLERLADRRRELVDELAAAREHAGCRELLDLDGMDAALRDWPDRARAHARWTRTTHVYRYNLLRSLLMCRYLRFFDAHAAGRSGL